MTQATKNVGHDVLQRLVRTRTVYLPTSGASTLLELLAHVDLGAQRHAVGALHIGRGGFPRIAR